MNERPLKPLDKPDFSRLQKLVEEGIADLYLNHREPKDFAHFVFEEALIAIYGKDVFKTYNQLLGEE